MTPQTNRTQSERIALRPLRRSELLLIYDALEWNAERLEGETWDDKAEQRDRLRREIRNLVFPPKVVLP